MLYLHDIIAAGPGVVATLALVLPPGLPANTLDLLDFYKQLSPSTPAASAVVKEFFVAPGAAQAHEMVTLRRSGEFIYITLAGAQSAPSANALDLTGAWKVVNTSGPGASGTLDITDGKGGVFDGTGYGGAYAVKGSVSGSSVHYTVSAAGYTATVDGTLNSADTRITYTWRDTSGTSGTGYLTR